MQNLYVISTPLALPAFTVAQSTTSDAPTVYVRASYTKWKPGTQAEGQKFWSDVVNKGVAAAVAADPESLGSIRLDRVFPGSAEIGHDAVTLQFRKSPPDLGRTTGTQPFYNAIGMSPEQYTVKISTLSDLVKQEIWTDTYRQGSIQEGDLVQIRFMDPPHGKAIDFIEVSRQFESPIRAEMIRRGAFKASQLFRLLQLRQPDCL